MEVEDTDQIEIASDAVEDENANDDVKPTEVTSDVPEVENANDDVKPTEVTSDVPEDENANDDVKPTEVTSDVPEEIANDDIKPMEATSDVTEDENANDDVKAKEATSDAPKDEPANDDVKPTEVTTDVPETKTVIDDVQQVEMSKGYPMHVFFIVANEFCERFSFYGMRTNLVLYARNFLLFDDDTSTAIFHAFTFFAYLMPLVGGIIADSFWGKYKTIAYLSIVYVVGHVFTTLSAIPYIPSQGTLIFLSMTGLFFMAVGTGGIKPCVSSFGADQFRPDQIKYRSQFFSMFYFSINGGAMLSKLLTPVLRADLNCYPGKVGPKFKQCYSVAYGVPGIIMLIAVVAFFAGSKYYTRLQPEGSIFWKFCKCIYSALKGKLKARNEVKEHWVDYADAPEELKEDTKRVLRVLYLFIPIPFFWALFDQQGSRWTLQALQMDRFWGDFLVKPDQIDVLNPLLILTLIPLFETTLYPLLRHWNINFTPIRRMTTGLLLAGVSFIFAAMLQFSIDADLTPLPSQHQFSVRVINIAPCDININSSSEIFNQLTVKANQVSNTKSNFMQSDSTLQLTLFGCNNNNKSLAKINVNASGEIVDIVLSLNGSSYQVLESQMTKEKLEDGNAVVTFINTDPNRALSLESSQISLNLLPGQRSNPIQIVKGSTRCNVYENSSNSNRTLYFSGSVETNIGGSYTVVIRTNNRSVEAVEWASGQYQLTDINPNSVNIAWMTPQYFIITVGEVFLSISGLEFSYSQAPVSMRSVVSSFWLLTVAFGNVIVLMVAESDTIDRQAYEFVLFAGLIGVAAIIFALLAGSYKMVDETEDMEKVNKKINVQEEKSPAL